MKPELPVAAVALLCLFVSAACTSQVQPTGIANVEIVSPTSALVLHGDVTFIIKQSGVVPKVVNFLVDDKEIPSLSYEGTAVVLDSTLAPDGMHNFSAKAYGEGTNWLSPPVAFLVDNTHPSASFSPSPGDANVDVRQTIEVAFSEAVDPVTVTSESVQLWNGSSQVQADVTLSSDQLHATVTPKVALTAPVHLEGRLSASIVDTAGNAVTLPPVPWAWDVPIWRVVQPPAAVSSGWNVTQPGSAGSSPYLFVTNADGSKPGSAYSLQSAIWVAQPDESDAAANLDQVLALSGKDGKLWLLNQTTSGTSVVYNSYAWSTTWSYLGSNPNIQSVSVPNPGSLFPYKTLSFPVSLAVSPSSDFVAMTSVQLSSGSQTAGPVAASVLVDGSWFGLEAVPTTGYAAAAAVDSQGSVHVAVLSGTTPGNSDYQGLATYSLDGNNWYQDAHTNGFPAPAYTQMANPGTAPRNLRLLMNGGVSYLVAVHADTTLSVISLAGVGSGYTSIGDSDLSAALPCFDVYRSAALSSQGDLLAATDCRVTPALKVKRYRAGTWTTLPGLPSGLMASSASAATALTFDSLGRPVVVGFGNESLILNE